MTSPVYGAIVCVIKVGKSVEAVHKVLKKKLDP